MHGDHCPSKRVRLRVHCVCRGQRAHERALGGHDGRRATAAAHHSPVSPADAEAADGDSASARSTRGDLATRWWLP